MTRTFSLCINTNITTCGSNNAKCYKEQHSKDLSCMSNFCNLPAQSLTRATLLQTQIGGVLQGNVGGHGMCVPLKAYTSGKKERTTNYMNYLT